MTSARFNLDNFVDMLPYSNCAEKLTATIATHYQLRTITKSCETASNLHDSIHLTGLYLNFIVCTFTSIAHIHGEFLQINKPLLTQLKIFFYF